MSSYKHISLEKMRALGFESNDEINEMYSLFLNEIKNTQELFPSLIADKDRDALKHHIHKMHGACCYCSAPSLKSICQSLENKLNNNDTAFETLTVEFEQLLNEIQSVIMDINHLLQK